MKRLSFLSLFVAGSAFAKPNIIFILTDDMSWTGTSVQIAPQVPESKSDFYQTPNIEKLASQGMSFAAAYAPGPMCTPSRAAILTGKTPAELHMTTPGAGRAQDYQKLLSADFIRELPASETTIAEVLQAEGYATAHLGKWHLGRSTPGEHGFDVHDGSTANDGPGEYADPNPKDVFGITERAIDFIENQAAAQKPFYLQLSHYAVHTPIEALEISKAKFADIPAGDRHDDIEYAAMTWDLDTSIGILLKKISELNLTDNTYVVLMSDNGAPGNPRESQNLPLAGGKGSLYEGGIRVPLIVRGPDITAESFSSESVTGCDLFPTFSEWAGHSLSELTEGSSLVPLLTGSPESFNRSEAALLFHYPHYGQGPMQKPQSALILDHYKLLKNWEDGSVQLFDLTADISEAKNLALEMPEKADALEKRLNVRLQEVNAQLPTENSNYDSNAKATRRKRM
ncbi:sulfatase [Coraliomargarita sp. W4R53]